MRWQFDKNPIVRRCVQRIVHSPNQERLCGLNREWDRWAVCSCADVATKWSVHTGTRHTAISLCVYAMGDCVFGSVCGMKVAECYSIQKCVHTLFVVLMKIDTYTSPQRHTHTHIQSHWHENKWGIEEEKRNIHAVRDGFSTVYWWITAIVW